MWRRALRPRRNTRAVACRRIVIGGKAKSGWVRGGAGAALAARELQRALGVAVQGDVARLDLPYTGDAQSSMERRVTRRRLEARQAGTVHALEALKPTWTGGGHGVHWRRGGLGAAMEMTQPKLGGPESSAANTQDTARLGVPYTGGAQITGDWRAALRSLEAWQAGSGHTRSTAKAAWFGGGGWEAEPHPPPFYRLPKLILPSDIFGVKISSARCVVCGARLTRSARFFSLGNYL